MLHLIAPSRCEADTEALGAAIGAAARVGDLIALDGELGAGKTQLVRGLAAGLGLDPDQVSSPTFVIATEYARPRPGAAPPRCPLVHADAYRLAGGEDLEALGFDELTLGAVAAVEWASRVGAELAARAGGPELLARLTLEHAPAPAPALAPAPVSARGGDAPQTGLRRAVMAFPRSWADRPEWPALVGLVSDLNVAAGAREATVCPISGRPVPADAPTWPFADERARMADLGGWFTGRYRLSRPLGPSDEAEAT
jgi:tRNA threonylcarbamoyladenosine biosynthesis protein TsaE